MVENFIHNRPLYRELVAHKPNIESKLQKKNPDILPALQDADFFDKGKLLLQIIKPLKNCIKLVESDTCAAATVAGLWLNTRRSFAELMPGSLFGGSPLKARFNKEYLGKYYAMAVTPAHWAALQLHLNDECSAAIFKKDDIAVDKDDKENETKVKELLNDNERIQALNWLGVRIDSDFCDSWITGRIESCLKVIH